MRTLLVLVALTIGTSVPLAQAPGDDTGHGLLAACEDGELTDPQAVGRAMYCLGVVRGVTGAIESLRATGEFPIPVCVPAEVTTAQATRLVARYLHDHPDELDEPGTTLILRALRMTFPCR